MFKKLGVIIGTRELRLDNATGATAKVLIEVGAPRSLGEDCSDYYCPYRIAGFRREIVSMAVGVDALQALLLTLIKIGDEVRRAAEAEGARLVWLEGRADLGFPPADILRGHLE